MNPDAAIQWHSYVISRKYDLLLNFLIHEEYDIDQQDDDGQTALHLACMAEGSKVNHDITKALLAFDANVNMFNASCKTPLDLANCYPDSQLNDILERLNGKTYAQLYKEEGMNFHKELKQTHDQPLASQLATSAGQPVTPLESINGPTEDSQQERKELAEEPDGRRSPCLMSSAMSPKHTKKINESPTDATDTPKGTPRDRSAVMMISGDERGMSRQQPKCSVEVQDSKHNPNMEIQRSALGVCSVHKEIKVHPAHVVSLDGVGLDSWDGGGPDKVRILCLDGGGMKGLVQIEMLKTIEQKTGKPITELFDWIVGTSTGGILALGIIYGKLSLKELRKMYFEMKDTVFKKQSKIVSHICNTDALEKLLKDKLGTEMTMECIKKPKVLITAVHKSTTKLPLVFFSNCSCPEDSDKKFIEHELVWEVARCTSAAPVFFSEHNNYVDGGVKANNPTSFALTEIQDYLSKTHGNYKISCVVSLGCGEYPEEPLGNTDIADVMNVPKVHHVFHRVSSLWTLFKHALNVSEETVRMCRISCEQQDIAFFRFSPSIGNDVGTTEKNNRKLCDIIIKTKELFTDPELAGQVENMIKELSL